MNKQLLIIGIIVIFVICNLSGCVEEPKNKKPTACFTYTETPIFENHEIEFYDCSEDEDGIIVAWLWDFGDGSISEEQNVTHNYSVPGNYNLTLTVTDNNGLTSVPRSEWITVFYFIDSPPNASFEYIPIVNITTNTEIQFNDTSTTYFDTPSQVIVDYFWDFDDGNTSNLKNPKHTYDEPGYYYVQLTVTNMANVSTTAVEIIEIRESI